MQKFFAISRSDNSYIVNAETMEELNAKLDVIREKHRDYYRRFISPGYYVVKAENLKEAKAHKRHVSFDLPLFKNAAVEYLAYTPIVGTLELKLENTFSTLEQALDWFRTRPEQTGQVDMENSSGKTVRSYSIDDIRQMIEEQDRKKRQETINQQLKLF